jgi:hypothetical protein
MHRIGWMQLNSPYDTLSTDPFLGVLAVLLLIEMLADKIPAVDSLNDMLQTFIRPAAGSVLFAANSPGVAGMSNESMLLMSLLAGAVSAGSVHSVKASVRPAVTLGTAGMGNPVVSLIEDIISATVSLIAILLPYLIIFFSLSLISILGWWVWDMRRVRRYFRQDNLGLPS